MHNERVIWVYNSGVVRFGRLYWFFAISLKANLFFCAEKMRNLLNIDITWFPWRMTWNEMKTSSLKIALFIFIIGVFCIQWNQKLRLSIRDNTRSFHADQLCTTNLNYWWRQNLLHSDRQNSNLEAVTVDINSMTLIVDITRFFLQNIYKYIEQFVCAIVNLTKCGIYF